MLRLMKYNKLKNMTDKKFKRKVGIPRVVFEILVEIISMELKEKHKKGGRKPNLEVEDILLLTLTYYRDYNTYFQLGFDFGIDESNAYRWQQWCEKILVKHFAGMINVSEININHEHLVDVMECSIQRPKDKEIQKEYYSGKKKRHTIKLQVIMDEVTKKIVGIEVDKGSVHDFEVFKKTTNDLDKLMQFLADSGYQGIDKIFPNSMTPKKKSKNNPLTDEDKELNKLISSIRISVEHVNCQLKIFRILAERYRSRIKTFYSKVLLICSFYNFCL